MMRALPSLLIAALLAMPLPAAAASVVREQGGSAMHHRAIRHLAGHRVAGLHRTAPGLSRFRANSPFGVLPFGGYGAVPLGGYDAPLAEGAATPLVMAAPPPQPARSEADERPTVEVTTSGVEIVRGPGTRHTGR